MRNWHQARPVVLTALAAATASALLAGCSSNPASSDVEPPRYYVRTSPDSVLINLRTAYENENLGVYLDCLAEDFTFYPSQGALIELDWLPESWGKETEAQVHHRMFDRNGSFRRIDLEMLRSGEPVEVPGPNPEDPVQYEYTFEIDLRIFADGNFYYIATAPSLFVLRIDPDELSPAGHDLWEIVTWYDLDEETCGRPVLPISWGEIKALFMDPEKM